jgi:hypothetical protein
MTMEMMPVGPWRREVKKRPGTAKVPVRKKMMVKVASSVEAVMPEMTVMMPEMPEIKSAMMPEMRAVAMPEMKTAAYVPIKTHCQRPRIVTVRIPVPSGMRRRNPCEAD